MVTKSNVVLQNMSINFAKRQFETNQTKISNNYKNVKICAILGSKMCEKWAQKCGKMCENILQKKIAGRLPENSCDIFVDLQSQKIVKHSRFQRSPLLGTFIAHMSSFDLKQIQTKLKF